MIPHKTSHLGLTCFLGKLYDENFLPGCCRDGTEPLLTGWTAFLSRELAFWVNSYTTVNRMLQCLITKEPTSLMLQARELLLSQFLLAEGPRAVDEKSYDAASYLASEGALRHVSGFRFMIASPLLRLVLMAKLGTIGGDHLAKPTKPLPYNSNGLDVAAIITEAVDHFDKRSIVHAFRSSYKKNKATGNVAYLRGKCTC
mgnify:FL=1